MQRRVRQGFEGAESRLGSHEGDTRNSIGAAVDVVVRHRCGMVGAIERKESGLKEEDGMAVA